MAIENKVLVYRLGSLGDTVVALPCFHKIKQVYPEAAITLLTNKPVATKAAPMEAILGTNKNSYFFDTIIDYPVGTRNPIQIFKLIWTIRRTGAKTLVNITAARTKKAATRDKLFFKLAGIKKTIGFPELEKDFVVTIDPETNLYEWEAKRLARRLLELGPIDLKDPSNWNLRLTTQEQSVAETYLKDIPNPSRIIAASVGTKAQSKDWEMHNWEGLLSMLRVQYKDDWTLLMIGAPDEYELAERCLNVWGGAGLNLCGKTTPRESAVILSKVTLFIGHDSGPMHLSGCVGTPCIGIFAAQNPAGQWYPRGSDKNIILYHETDCARCGLSVCIEQKKKCILSITVLEVKAAVDKLLSTPQ